jgi:hypothetical protein
MYGGVCIHGPLIFVIRLVGHRPKRIRHANLHKSCQEIFLPMGPGFSRCRPISSASFAYLSVGSVVSVLPGVDYPITLFT